MKIANAMLLATTALAAVAYENDTGWKLDADGKIETDGDGNPLYVGDDGKATAVKYETAVQLRGEAKNYRTRAEKAEADLRKFEGIDPDAARKAIEKMKDVNLDDLVNKDKIEEAKQQIRTQLQADIDERETKNKTLADENRKLRLDNAFNSSDFLKDRVALPQDAVRATFSNRFDVQDGKVVALTADGNVMLNKRGDPASVDEAFDMMISERTDKDNWIKAPDASGSGSQGGAGGRGGGNVVKRSDYDAMDQDKKAEIGQKLAKGEVRLVD